MSETIQLGDDLSLPADLVTQTIGILANRGSGKTYTAMVMVEGMVRAGWPVAVIDPVGAAWGLRSNAGGDGPGLPVVVMGGDHGDLPLPVTSGAAVADLVVAERFPVVLDLSLLRKGEQVRFVTDFAERLYHRNRRPLHLVIDEADAFAPQRAMPDQARCLGAVQDIVRRGRIKGLGVTLITQRPAVISKDVLTQISTLIVLRLVAPQDRKAIDAWVEANGTREQRDELMASLASLPTGDAWVWSPDWLDGLFARVRIRTRETFDSSATPTMGEERVVPTTLADVDVERIRAALGEAVAETERDDPKALRAKIAGLERRLADRPATDRLVERVEVEVPVPTIPPWVRELVQDIGRRIAAAGDAATELADAVDDIERTDEPWGGGLSAPVPGRNTPAATPPVEIPAPWSVTVAPPEEDLDRDGDDVTIGVARAAVGIEVHGVGLGPSALRILRTLVDVGAPLRLAHAAALSDMSHRGGAFAKHIADLRRAGLIVGAGPGIVAATADGREAADLGRGGATPRLTGEGIRARWRGVFSANAGAMLDRLAEVYPQAASRDDLAAAAGMAPRGGAFQGYVSELRDRELVDLAGAGMLRLIVGAHYPLEGGTP